MLLRNHFRNPLLFVISCLFTSFVAVIATPDAVAQHAHQHDSATAAKPVELGTSAAFDKQGNLWALTKEVDQNGSPFVALRRSSDMGKQWSTPQTVAREPVTARGDERPKIAFGPKNEMYIVYTKPLGSPNPHIGDIRFTRSLDGGKTFSEPVTVHANRDVIVHSFGSLIVDKSGIIYVAWIDNRDKEQSKQRQQAYSGNAIYYAVSTDGGKTFKGDYKIADNTCECCRISLALTPQGHPVAMWRHIFDSNVRDHALAELNPDGHAGKPVRTTFDDWRVDACPHHGPSIAFAPDGTRHQVWFNGKEGAGGGVQYASTDAKGQLGQPISLGSAQASYADIAVQGRRVAIVWKQFNGQATAIVGKVSDDGGSTWREQELATTTGDSDKPYLVAAKSGILLIWNSKDEGIRVISVAKST